MSMIVKADLSEIKEYTGKSVSAKIGKKSHPVLFRVNVDNFSVEEAIDVAKRDSNIVMLNYIGSPAGLANIDTKGVYITFSVEVGNDVSEEDIVKYIADIPEGVTLVVKLPEEFKNIRFAYEMSQKYDKVRFCGGCLFCFDECRFGCLGRDICTQKGIKFDDTEYIKTGCSCCIPIDDIANVELSISNSKQKSSSHSGNKSKNSKASLFSSLLYSGGKVEL